MAKNWRKHKIWDFLTSQIFTGFNKMVTSSLITQYNFSPLVVIPLVLLMGMAFGGFPGLLIQTFDIAPFIVTLGGLYLARGLCYIVSIDTIAINHPFFVNVAGFQIKPLFFLGDNSFISINIVIAIVGIILAIFLAHYTKFGRTVYAIGGNEQSALLMGLPVKRAKILLYTFSGFCSALAGMSLLFIWFRDMRCMGKGWSLTPLRRWLSVVPC